MRRIPVSLGIRRLKPPLGPAAEAAERAASLQRQCRAASLLAGVLAAVALTTPLVAQCPDGTPPPCAGARAPDVHRIAILPFRVTTADTLLGEGIPELLAAEFTGENGPRAVHMGTV